MRVLAGVLALVVGASACGGPGAGSPVSPSPKVTLPDGNYLLAVYSSSFGCLVVSHGRGGTPNNSVQIPVVVSRDGEEWRVTSREEAGGTLQMKLVANAVGVDGRAWGTLAQPGVLVTLQHDVNGVATGGSDGVVGAVDGSVNYSGASAAAFCSTNLWSLTRERR